jgi:hypothetical protein
MMGLSVGGRPLYGEEVEPGSSGAEVGVDRNDLGAEMLEAEVVAVLIVDDVLDPATMPGT